MFNILVVEDSKVVQEVVREALGERFQCTCAFNAAQAFELMNKTPFDLFILDIHLPDGDGFQLCARIRSDDLTRDTPIIFLTGKSGLTDKVMGFSLGADDYVVKPFEPLELKARVEAKLNRLREKREIAEVISRGDLSVNISFQKATLISQGDVDLGFTPIEFKMLIHFMKHEEYVLSRAQLVASVWGEKGDLSDRTVDKHISSLRQKLKDCSSYIQTVPGSGYRFSVPAVNKKSA